MKTLKLYREIYSSQYLTDDFLSVIRMEDLWPYVLADKLTEIEMDTVEFLVFCKLFLHKFPHDWDKETFMGVKIHVK